MKGWEGDASYHVDRVAFDYHGGRHIGSGLLRWSPTKGFHLEAKLTTVPPLPPGGVGFGHIGLVPRRDYCGLRLRLAGGGHVFVPPLPIVDHLEILFLGQLSIRFPAALFFETNQAATRGQKWTGTAIIKTASRLILPEQLDRTTRVGRRVAHRTISWEGFSFGGRNATHVVGYVVDDTTLEVQWSLPAESRNRGEAWRLAWAIRDALGILYGQSIGVTWREIRRGTTATSEIRLCGEVAQLGAFAPFYDRPITSDMIQRFVQFFLADSPDAETCRQMFRQMLDAFNQRSVAAIELLMGTILEAALRSFERAPFALGGSFDVERSLSHFRDRFWSGEWRPHCKRAVTAFRRLRHRNAHPDWIAEPGGGLSDVMAAQHTSDMLFLTRFYGFMILAFIGVKDLQPAFPAEGPVPAGSGLPGSR